MPNVKNVEEKSILQINEAVIDLRDRAQTGGLVADDYADGTFSISSVGNIGGTYSVPVILRP